MAKIPINMKSGEVVQKEIIIGIDLGTTNSLVAYMKDGNNHIVKDEKGKNSLVPSIVHFNNSGEIIVGESAKKHLVSSPERTIYSVKRLLGKSYEDLSDYADKLAYEIIDEEDALVKLRIDNKTYSPIELSAEILKHLKLRIEKHLGQSVSKAVITVPAYFNDSQRQATRDAGKLAGLDVLRIINEPTAASLAYGFGKKDGDSEIIAVYDLGGGTFDVSILRIENGVFDVLSTNGDTFLGGDDFDRAIIEHWMTEYDIDSGAMDKSMQQSLRLRAEEAKKILSSETEYTSKDGRFSLSRITFDKLIKGFIERTMTHVKQAIDDADIQNTDLDKIILVGGSTRIPKISQELESRFQVSVLDDINPDEVVALGAAIQADILAGNTSDYLLIDVTPLSLGIETMGGLMDVIIPRNSKVPVSAGRQYTTSVDGQKNLKIAVYQGERELVQHNRKLGEFILSDIPPMPAGIPKIEVQFIIDADGILKVRAKELRSEKMTEVNIQSQYGIPEEQMAKMLLDSIKNAESDMKFKALQESINEASSMIHSAHKFIEQNKSWLEAAHLERIENYISELNQHIENKDKEKIDTSLHEMNNYSRPLAEKAMNENIRKALEGKKL